MILIESTKYHTFYKVEPQIENGIPYVVAKNNQGEIVGQGVTIKGCKEYLKNNLTKLNK